VLERSIRTKTTPVKLNVAGVGVARTLIFFAPLSEFFRFSKRGSGKDKKIIGQKA